MACERLRNLLRAAAWEQIFFALVDPATPTHLRGTFALKVLEHLGDEAPAPTEGQRVLNMEVIRQIREKVYGIYDPEPQNTDEKTGISGIGLRNY
ncbi:hypothetical protein [Gloeomargarita lithophora]|uniref:hypothetical protein n=1 Tax=Gloeomargarita lithophora TaxID=1188228 RepID=UPI0008F7F5D0|nr:hypothetical protein [Gloeomargarita lithophora]